MANNGLLAINRTGLALDHRPGEQLRHHHPHRRGHHHPDRAPTPAPALINGPGQRYGFGTTAGTRQTPAVLVETNGLTNTATLDMANRDLMIHSGSSAAYEAQVTNSYDFGLWNLPGITSSTAAAASGATSLGIMSGADYNNFSPNTGTFDGKPVANSDTLIKYTYAGDINLDGLVNDDDLFQFLAEYLGPQTGNYALGDMTYDGLVNDDDLFVFLSNYLNQPAQPLSTGLASAPAGGGLSGGSSGAVPEPTSLALLGIGAAGMLIRRKKRR